MEKRMSENGKDFGWNELRQRFALPVHPLIQVVGLGRTGLSVCHFLSQFDCDVMVSDRQQTPALHEAIERLPRRPVGIDLGGDGHEGCAAADCIVLSPGVPLDQPVFREARSKGTPIINDIEMSHVFHRGPIIGITGSNGKSTVTELTGSIFGRCSGRKITVAGNIGRPVLDLIDIGAGMNRQDEAPILVLELSSFQLETISHFTPDIGVLLNLTPDHLDRYSTVDEYYKTKMRLFMNQDSRCHAVLNYDDALTASYFQAIPHASLAWFSRVQAVPQGIWLDGERLIRCFSDGERRDIGELGDIRLRGAHNRENILAAMMVALLSGLEETEIIGGVRAFGGISHRFQHVATIAKREFINDSKATNIDSVRAGISNYPRPLRLIAGGRDKEGDFTTLREHVTAHVRQLYLIGEATDKIIAALGDIVPYTRCESLRQAVETAYVDSEAGETILLSPGCASYDMFRDFEDRGQQFIDVVNSIDR